MYISKNQWGFWLGRSNDFDLIRLGLQWSDYQTAKVCIVLVGVKLVVYFPACTWWETRRRFLSWWRPCPDCGGRFGKHDDSVDHLPF